LNTSSRAYASLSAGSSLSSTTSSARPTESASSACSSGYTEPSVVTTGSGNRSSRVSSRCVRRDRSAFNQARATIVVSQRRRLATSATSERLARSHASSRSSRNLGVIQ
jgi:hypothetical protein